MKAKWNVCAQRICSQNHLSIAISAMSVKRESIFSKKLARDAGGRAWARDGPSRLCISLSHLRISLSHLRISSSQRCISSSQQRDSCSCAWEQLIHEKVVPLSEKSYHFWKSPTTFGKALPLFHRYSCPVTGYSCLITGYSCPVSENS